MNDEEKLLEELKRRNQEREAEDRKAVEEMLEREKQEQEAVKKRLAEREMEDEKSAQAMLDREKQEQEEVKKRLDEREKEEQKIFEQNQQKEQEAIKKRVEERKREDHQAAQEMLDREKKEQEAVRNRLEEREKEEKKVTKESPPEKQKTKKISASLRPPSGSVQLDTYSDTLPVYYVIIGRGPAAIINHTTLRQTEFGKKRIAGLPVMHVGFSNPWTKYMQHGMGQPPHLLNLPGFKNHPAHLLKDEGLDSREFARCVESEYQRLETFYGKEKVITNETWVVWIQTSGCEKLAGDTKNELKKDGMTDEFIGQIETKLAEEFKNKTAALRLLLMNPKPPKLLEEKDIFFIYAAYIDICTGPGRPNVLPPLRGDTDECKKARTAAWLPPEKWEDQWGYELKQRKVMNGVEAIRDEVQWETDERVCVTAGGGVGLNAAERARNENCRLDWFARTSLMETFANPRNDTILRHPKENRILRPGESKILNWKKDDEIIPCEKKLRYGYGASLENTGIFGSKVEVSLAGGDKARIKDYFNKQVGFYSASMWDCSKEYETNCGQLPSQMYDRLVIPNGQASRALGHAYFFARHLKLTPLTAAAGNMIGLNTADGKVRVLGAAAQTYDKYGVLERNNADEAGKKMWLSWDALPVSAVPDGFIFSGLNIATANEFFNDKNPNNNVNTATQDEISNILAATFGSSDAALMAKVIVENRKRPDKNGYQTILQVIDALRSDEEAKEISSLALVAELLEMGYTKSADTKLLHDI